MVYPKRPLDDHHSVHFTICLKPEQMEKVKKTAHGVGKAPGSWARDALLEKAEASA